RVCPQISKGHIRIPSNPPVANRLLNYRVSESSDSDDWMAGARTITHKKHHAAARNTPINIHPSMTEISPNICQPKPCMLTDRTGFDNLQIRVNDGPQFTSPLLRISVGCRAAQARGQFFAVAHYRMDRMPSLAGKPPAFHGTDKFTY